MIWTTKRSQVPTGASRQAGQEAVVRHMVLTAIPKSSLSLERLSAVATELEPAGMDERVVVRAESRWPPALAVLVFVGLNAAVRLWLPAENVMAVPWLAPAIELVLLGVLVASDPLGVDGRAWWLRRVSMGLVLVLVGAALWATVILTDHLINGAAQTNSAGYLLASGALGVGGQQPGVSLVVIGLVVARAVNVLT